MLSLLFDPEAVQKHNKPFYLYVLPSLDARGFQRYTQAVKPLIVQAHKNFRRKVAQSMEGIVFFFFSG